jgi:hypothetical protein
VSANVEKYYKAFESPPEEGGESGAMGVTPNDLQAMEQRINATLTESIERLEKRINVSRETQNTETNPPESGDNTENKGE